MKQIFSLFAVVFAARETCDWFGANEGITVQCMPGWYAKGACSSGRRHQCKDGLLSTSYYSMIKCCQRSKYNDLEHDCDKVYGNAGQSVSCPNGYNLEGICSSGSRATCQNPNERSDSMTSLTCCQSTDYSVTNDDSQCEWKYGAAGDQVACKDSMLAVGFCGSGTDGTCFVDLNQNRTDHTGVKCCPYETVLF